MPGLLRHRVGDGGLGGGAEDLALAAGLGLLLGDVVDLLEHAGDREQEGGLEAAERGQQLLGVGLVADPHAGVHREHGDEPREDVRGRDEEQGRRAGLGHDLLERHGGVAAELDEVRVGEHAALRLAGRSRGVDERRDVGADREVAAALDLLVGHVGARRGELVEVAEVDLPDVADRGEVGVHLVEAREVVGRLEDDRDGAGVAEVPLHLRGGAGLVDRHEHRAGEPRREVDERPLVAGLAHEADLVAGLDARGDEALREGDDLVVELAAS